MVARGLQLAGLLVELDERAGKLPSALLDLLLETRVGRFEPGRHLVEFLGQGAQLVPAHDVDPLIQCAGADPRCGELNRLDGPGEIAGEEDAGDDGDAEEDDQQQCCPPDR